MKHTVKRNALPLLFIPACLILFFAGAIPTPAFQEHKHDDHNHGGLPKVPEKIEWSAKRKLTWKDYKGVWNNTRKNPLMTFIATYYSHHASKKGDSLIIETVPIFYPADSYYKPGMNTKEQLEHEQTRFNLYEVWARKLRKEYSTFIFSKATYSTFMQTMYKTNLQARNSEVLKYNRETNNGADPVKQKEWIGKINKELLALEKYSKKIVYAVPK